MATPTGDGFTSGARRFVVDASGKNACRVLGTSRARGRAGHQLIYSHDAAPGSAGQRWQDKCGDLLCVPLEDLRRAGTTPTAPAPSIHLTGGLQLLFAARTARVRAADPDAVPRSSGTSTGGPASPSTISAIPTCCGCAARRSATCRELLAVGVPPAPTRSGLGMSLALSGDAGAAG